MNTRPSSLVKKFAIAGLVLAEVYMVFTVVSPRLKGVDIPTASLALRIAAMALFFGPFGLAIGTGVGLLADSLWRALKGPSPKKPPTEA